MPTVRSFARKKLKAAVKKIVFMQSSEDLEITVGETQLTYEERFEKGHKVRNTQRLVGTEGSWELPWFPGNAATHTSNFSCLHQADRGKSSTIPRARMVLRLLQPSTLGCSLFHCS